MTDRIKNLEKSWENRKTSAMAKAITAIDAMLSEGVDINFNSVHTRSGLSKNYLYNAPEVRKRIDECRHHQEQQKAAMKKYDKTSKSKDIIISAKEKRIARLEEENKKLRSELEMLRGLLYDLK